VKGSKFSDAVQTLNFGNILNEQEDYKREKIIEGSNEREFFLEKMTTYTIVHVVEEDENTCECHAPSYISNKFSKPNIG